MQKVVGLQQEYDDLQNELQLANEDRRKTSNAADQLREVEIDLSNRGVMSVGVLTVVPGS